MKFDSKKNKTVIIILIVLPILELILSLALFKTDRLTAGVIMILGYLISCFIIRAMISTKYILDEKSLIISCLGIKRHISYDEIDKINEKKGSVTVQASSLPQICIELNNGTAVSVSPDRTADFIDSLNKRINKEK